MSGITYQSFQRDFRFEKRLGKGNFAVVNQVLHLLDQRRYAHKCIQLSSFEQVTLAFNQLDTIKSIDDDRIVKIVYFYFRDNKKTGKYELGIIMELCLYNLADLIKIRKRKNEYFNKNQLRDFLTTMIPFFAKMQRKSYLHRDIKPDNILLVKNVYNKLEYKIGDFGFAIKLNSYSTQNIAGTMQYVSPKLLVKFKDNKVIVPGHTYKDDVYSFGKTLYEYLTLEMNGKFNDKKMLECSSRYGPEIWGLTSLMIKDQECERPDFIYLENYCIRKMIIDSANSELSKENFLSISTVNGAQSKKKLSIDKIQKKSRGKNKIQIKEEDVTKTRKKDAEAENDLTRIETFAISRVNLKAQQKIMKKTILYREEVHSILAFEGLIFVGSQGKLGILLSGQKIFKFQLESPNLKILFMKVDPLLKNLLFTAANKFFIIDLSEIRKFIVSHKDELKKKNEYETSLKQLKYKQFQSNFYISTIDCQYEEKKEPTFILGHLTGQITMIRGETKTSSLSFSKVPITHVAYQQGYIYSSNWQGLFKKESSITLGLWNSKQAENNLYKPYSQLRFTSYKYSEPFTSFQIISSCKYNKKIQKQQNRYLAIVISYDGFAHLISRSFKLLKLVQLSQQAISSASFSANSESQIGVETCVADGEGSVYVYNVQDADPILIDKTQEKRISSICTSEINTILGSYQKKIIVLTKVQPFQVD